MKLLKLFIKNLTSLAVKYAILVKTYERIFCLGTFWSGDIFAGTLCPDTTEYMRGTAVSYRSCPSVAPPLEDYLVVWLTARHWPDTKLQYTNENGDGMGSAENCIIVITSKRKKASSKKKIPGIREYYRQQHQSLLSLQNAYMGLVLCNANCMP